MWVAQVGWLDVRGVCSGQVQREDMEGPSLLPDRPTGTWRCLVEGGPWAVPS